MHHEYSNGRSNESLLTFTIGLATGAGLALMFAPAAGRETRARLADGGRRMADRGRRMAERGRDAASAMANRVNHAVEKGTTAYRRAHDQANGGAGEPWRPQTDTAE